MGVLDRERVASAAGEVLRPEPLSMKWCRHLDAEIVDFTCLSDDYSKLAFICADRSIGFTPSLDYYQTRTPKQGRDVCYSDGLGTCAWWGSNEVWRLNLEQGRFLQPLESRYDELNVVESLRRTVCSPRGRRTGSWVFDLRARTSCGAIQCSERGEGGITSLRFDPNGLQMAVGNEEGIIRCTTFEALDRFA